MPSDDVDRAAPRLAGGEADYQRLANALPEVIWTCDAQGQLKWVNDRWTELTGMSRVESLRDKAPLAAVHPDDQAHLQERFANALATSRSCEMEYRIRNREGAYRFHFCRLVPVCDEHGAIVSWVAAAFDVHDRREMEEALRESERRFETVFLMNPQPAAITRVSDGTFLSVNDAFLKLAGLARDEIVGKTTVDLGFISRERRATEVVAPLTHGNSGRVEVTFSARDGWLRTLEVISGRIDVGGEPCLINVATDVTERRASEAALRNSEALARARADELAVLMDAVPAAVWIARDPECRDVRGNRMGRELLRVGEADNISKTAVDPAPTQHFRVFSNQMEMAPEQLPVQRAARGEEIRSWEEEVRFDDGQAIHLYGSAVPLRDPGGAPRGAIGAFVDVTRLKQAEAGLREADRRKDEFLALLSHELRNPLAPILTAVELMQLRGDVATPHERDVILRQGRHLLRLVDDLLDVSRVARGKVTLTKKRIELAGAVMKALEETAPLFEERRHQVNLRVASHGLPVDADEVRLVQVITNLFTNAARYTPPGGRVEVTAARQGDEIVLVVSDTGVGIDADLLPHVFEMFVQDPRGPDRSQGGLGLGLSLVRMLTELHGGTVSAESAGEGGGSTFTIRLPASAPIVVEAHPGAGGPGWVASDVARRVLVVDDNRDAAEMLSLLLARAGHRVEIAADASQALSAADSFRPQIAILDIGLPVMDGYALGRELRARMNGSPPILIALTGYGQEQDRLRSKEAGFASHLVKPVDAKKLIHLVDALARPGTPAPARSD
jgi:PAS domain S-box-containing protein